MPITTDCAIFFLIWWVVLFAVLPWGVHGQQEAGEIVPGSDPGAPAIPNLRWKLVWTTLIAAVIFATFDVVYAERWITIEGLMTRFENNNKMK
jgi:predicted secreted protein